MDQMRTLKQRLLSLDKDIRVGIVGIGTAGKALTYQVQLTPGMRPAALADPEIQNAIGCAEWLKVDFEIVHTVSDLNYIVQCGKLAITDNADLIASSGLIHVFVESSTSPFQGAIHALKALRNHQHVVMMNHEADLMYGGMLFRAAQEEGLVYTLADGGQPAAVKKLIDEIELSGLQIVMAGASQEALNRYSDPVNNAHEADKSGRNHKVYTSHLDGTRLNINMAVLANSLNGQTLQPGMIGTRVKNVNEVLTAFQFDDIWNGKNPIVDYVIGAEPRGSVFIVARADDSFQRQALNNFAADLGTGPYYIFTRPFYLQHIETIQCIGEAYLEGSARLQPLYGSQTNVIAYAKRNLRQGERLDGPGGFLSYGLIENLDDSRKPGLPILLSENLKLKRDIGKDERLSLDDVEFHGDDQMFSMFFQSLELSRLRNSVRMKEPVHQSYQVVV
jgi:predicted homoserine dehydrogenase-like protein